MRCRRSEKRVVYDLLQPGLLQRNGLFIVNLIEIINLIVFIAQTNAKQPGNSIFLGKMRFLPTATHSGAVWKLFVQLRELPPCSWKERAPETLKTRIKCRKMATLGRKWRKWSRFRPPNNFLVGRQQTDLGTSTANKHRGFCSGYFIIKYYRFYRILSKSDKTQIGFYTAQN